MRLGLVQMTSTRHHESNIVFARETVAQAASKGCHMVAFPEVAGMMNRKLPHERELVGPEKTDPWVAACRELAADHGLWIHTGSTPITRTDDERFLNHSNLIDNFGKIVAAYDKIHLFDIYPENAPPILESKRYAPGETTAIANTPWGGLGMSICYDLRFPHLYRHYAQSGAKMLFIPSAFTVPTGIAHWEVLLRARAIENGCFVVASAQVGTHEDGRETYGHSMIVDPTGRVIEDMGNTTGLAVVEMDIGLVDQARARIPSLQHDRPIG